MHNDEFEWEDRKATANLKKHGIDFFDAIKVFDDVFAAENADSASSKEETRFLITGMVNGQLITVVYTERGQRIRLISARKATKHEQRNYYEGQA
jgi:uncharacterized protein